MNCARIKRCFNTLLAVLAILTAGLFVSGVIRANSSADTSASPRGFTVILDAGHGGADGGAVGVNGTVEAGLNLMVAELVRDALNNAGCTVIMTRTGADALADSKSADMQARRDIISQDADAVVSIHMNKFSDRSVKGSMAFYMIGSDEGKLLAQSVINAVTAATGQGSRLANPGDYFIIRECPAPAVLVECGFLSNSAEEELLNSAQYRQKLASAIAEGVMEYLCLRYS